MNYVETHAEATIRVLDNGDLIIYKEALIVHIDSSNQCNSFKLNGVQYYVIGNKIIEKRR